MNFFTCQVIVIKYPTTRPKATTSIIGIGFAQLSEHLSGKLWYKQQAKYNNKHTTNKQKQDWL